MLIILEGVDGTGKTTLANQLTASLWNARGTVEVNVIHRGPPTGHPVDEYLRPLTDYRPGTGRHIILDRWHWGERVYPALRGRSTQLDEPTWWHIENYLRRLGAVVVQCTRAPSKILETLRERNESHVLTQLTELPRAMAGFEAARRRSVLPFASYNCDHAQSHDAPGVISHAVAFEEQFTDLAAFTTYVGPRLPAALLLGDVRHHVSPSEQEVLYEWERDHDPAFVPLPATSGHYLLRALNDIVGDVRHQVGLANACDVDDVVKLWETLDTPPVVALGGNAARRLTKLKVPHVRVPHPQFIRRFHHRQGAEYAALIMQAIQRQGDSSCPTSLPAEPVSTFTIKF